MAVKKIYQYAEVKAAIDMANQHYYRQFLRVRNDVSNRDFGKKSIKGIERDAQGIAKNPMDWQGRGSDVGHAFRHVEGTSAPGKSTYEDDYEMVMCTREMLNSEKGQRILGEIDTANPAGDEVGGHINRRLVVNITGSYYGFTSGDKTNKKKIKTATCELMKVGESTLWIHSTYPSKFQ